ncbi:MAG: peptidylprolyl isomerase SurA [Arsenophonus sp.]
MKFWKKLIIGLLFTINTKTFAIPQELDKISVIVNDGVILQSDINHMLDIMKINARNTEQQLPNENRLRHQILEKLIIEKIILQLAKKMQIQIPDKEIDLSISNFAAQNGLTIDQLQERLSTDGINLLNYRKNVYKEMMILKVRNNEVRQRITISPKEVDSLATKLNSQAIRNANVNLSQILIPLQKNPTNEQIKSAMNKVNIVMMKLKQSVDFRKLSTIYSIDINALKGGQLGWSKIEELPVLFAQRIQNAKKGDIIGPIRSSIGFHIFKLNDVKNNNIPISVTEVKVRHILIKISPIVNYEEANEKIQQIYKQIQIGKITFIEAAKKYSQDLDSAFRGGELNWNILSAYDPAFRDGLINLNKGEISKPIQSSFGWHLIQLEDTRQVNETDLLYKDTAYRLLFNHKLSKETQIWIEELRKSSYVKILNG